MQSRSPVCIPNLPAQVVALLMLFIKLSAPIACPQLLPEPSSHCPYTPVTSCQCLLEINRSGQPVYRLACSLLGSQEPRKWPSGYSPVISQNLPQKEMSHSYTSPAFPWAKKRRGYQQRPCEWHCGTGRHGQGLSERGAEAGGERVGGDPMWKGWEDLRRALENFFLPCPVPAAALLTSPKIILAWESWGLAV